MAYKISVDDEACIGCGACEGMFPDFFKMNDDGKAETKKSSFDKLKVDEVKDTCPVSAIEVKEAKK